MFEFFASGKRVKVDVDHPIEISGQPSRVLFEIIEIKSVVALLVALQVLRKNERPKITYGNLVGRRVLDDFSAQIARFDRARKFC